MKTDVNTRYRSHSVSNWNTERRGRAAQLVQRLIEKPGTNTDAGSSACESSDFSPTVNFQCRLLHCPYSHRMH